MAGITFPAIVAAMNVVYLVAAETVLGCVLVFLVDMTGITARILMCAFQWKISFVVIELCVFPVC